MHVIFVYFVRGGFRTKKKVHAKGTKQVRESAAVSGRTKISCVRKVGGPRIRKLSVYETFWICSRFLGSWCTQGSLKALFFLLIMFPFCGIFSSPNTNSLFLSFSQHERAERLPRHRLVHTHRRRRQDRTLRHRRPAVVEGDLRHHRRHQRQEYLLLHRGGRSAPPPPPGRGAPPPPPGRY